MKQKNETDYFHGQLRSTVKFYEELVKHRNPIKEGERGEALKYIKDVKKEQFLKMCEKLDAKQKEKGNWGTLDYSLTIKEIKELTDL